MALIFLSILQGKEDIMAVGKYKRIGYDDRLKLEKLFNFKRVSDEDMTAEEKVKAEVKMTFDEIASVTDFSKSNLVKEKKRGMNKNTGKYEALIAQLAYCSTPK